MNYHYTHLGAVPAIARRANERRDAMLARTGPAARAVLYRINRLPRAQRVPEMNRVLAAFEPGLPSRLHRTTEYLRREGMPIEAAVERALALSLADASIEKIKQVGRRVQTGRYFPVGGLGQATTDQGEDAAEVVGRMFQGIACSEGIATSTTNMVGRNEGSDAADAMQIGFGVLRGVSMCPPGAVMEPPVPLPPEVPSARRSPMVPIVIGVVGLAVVGGAVWFMASKKK